MAYPRRRFRRRIPYKRTKKYGKKYGRRRFKNKRFASTRTTNVSRNLVARNQFVKLPWSYTDRRTFEASSLAPIRYAFSGSTQSPSLFHGGVGINVDHDRPKPAGFDQYAKMYNSARVHGSSIKVELLTNSGSDQASNNTGQAVRLCLLALPYDSSDEMQQRIVGSGYWINQNPVSPRDVSFTSLGTSSTLATIWNASYERLINHPYAKWFTLGGSSSASRCTMKMFRKTKSMCQVKDLKDNESFEFTTGQQIRLATPDTMFGPDDGFVYYLFVFPTKPATTQDSIVLTVKMKYYFEFFDLVPPQNEAWTDLSAES